jgi:hypothetical protein
MKKGKNGNGNGHSRFYGMPLPGVRTEDLSGSLIVVEGTDGSGRSTQISLLTEWLEGSKARDSQSRRWGCGGRFWSARTLTGCWPKTR